METKRYKEGKALFEVLRKKFKNVHCAKCLSNYEKILRKHALQ